MASKTNIGNWAMLKVGEDIFTDVDTDGTATADKFNAIYTISLEDILDGGPEKGWRFANRRSHGINRDSAIITAFAVLVADSTVTVTATHALVAGDMVTIAGTTSYDGDYDVVSVSTTVSFVISATFVADDATGTAKWTSEEFLYRFARPTSIRVTETSVGGVELTDWKREGSYILTNQEDTDVDMKYIAAVAGLTATNFPPHFVNAFILKLASDLAYDLVQNSVFGDRLLQEYETIVLPRAIGLDNREIYVREKSSSWADAGHTRTVLE